MSEFFGKLKISSHEINEKKDNWPIDKQRH